MRLLGRYFWVAYETPFLPDMNIIFCATFMNYLFVNKEIMVSQTNASFWDKMRPSSVLFVCQQLTMGGKLLHFGGSADMQYSGSDYMDMLMYARLDVTTLDTSCVCSLLLKQNFFFRLHFLFLLQVSLFSVRTSHTTNSLQTIKYFF